MDVNGGDVAGDSVLKASEVGVGGWGDGAVIARE